MYDLDILVQGYPGKTGHHGGLGWSTVALLHNSDRVVLVDTGAYGCRGLISRKLGDLGFQRHDITDVLITHCHWDHMCNFPLFPMARMFAPRSDVEWALAQEVGTWAIPEFHVEALSEDRRTTLIDPGDEVLPGIRAMDASGHTPGSLAYVAAGHRASYILTGDAVKNQAELVSGQTDMTLDPAVSRASIARIRDLASADPGHILVCGHDRLLSLVDGSVAYRSELVASIRARLSADFNDEHVINLAP